MSKTSEIYQAVTDTIIQHLKDGNTPWHNNWQDNTFYGLPLRSTGEAYRGVNIVMLWLAAHDRGFTQPVWLTFKQAQLAGGSVRKGERSTPVTYFKMLERDDENGEPVEIPMLRQYRVFNLDQIDGVDPVRPIEPINPDQRNSDLDKFITATGIEIRTGSSKAFYSPSSDYIRMPEFDQFHSAHDYYSVAFHELTHATGHNSRCDRKFGTSCDSAEYAFEELVAELGAAFLCAATGVSPQPRPCHAGYLDRYLQLLEGDYRAIFRATSQAQKAADYLLQAQNPASERA